MERNIHTRLIWMRDISSTWSRVNGKGKLPSAGPTQCVWRVCRTNGNGIIFYKPYKNGWRVYYIIEWSNWSSSSRTSQKRTAKHHLHPCIFCIGYGYILWMWCVFVIVGVALLQRFCASTALYQYRLCGIIRNRFIIPKSHYNYTDTHTHIERERCGKRKT